MSDAASGLRSIEVSADQHYSEVFSSLRSLQSHGELCDVEIRTGNGTILAHKVVLAAVAPYFDVMFAGNMEDSRVYRITLQSIDHEILNKLILHAYGCTLVVSEENVQALLVAADFLQLQHVTEKCSEFIIDYILNNENALGIGELFSALGHSSRVLEVEKFVKTNFLSITLTEEFITLPIDKLVELLSRNNLNVIEEDVFIAAARWIEHCPARVQVAFRVLSCVRLRLLRKEFLFNVVARHQAFLSDNSCRRLIDEAKSYLRKRDPCLRALFSRSGRRSSYRYWALFLVGGLNYGVRFAKEAKYDFFTEKWSEIARMNIPRTSHAVAVNDRKMSHYLLSEFQFFLFVRLLFVWMSILPLGSML
ncbi:hypothetical protein RB195_015950 [Necator americanus]|uniref:BTB domain-containing protein n=1 Tax=Necator americanus TaxID=51031 RepID=A0ABR1E6V1_NECAM